MSRLALASLVNGIVFVSKKYSSIRSISPLSHVFIQSVKKDMRGKFVRRFKPSTKDSITNIIFKSVQHNQILNLKKKYFQCIALTVLLVLLCSASVLTTWVPFW